MKTVKSKLDYIVNVLLFISFNSLILGFSVKIANWILIVILTFHLVLLAIRNKKNKNVSILVRQLLVIGLVFFTSVVISYKFRTEYLLFFMIFQIFSSIELIKGFIDQKIFKNIITFCLINFIFGILNYYFTFNQLYLFKDQQRYFLPLLFILYLFNTKVYFEVYENNLNRIENGA